MGKTLSQVLELPMLEYLAFARHLAFYPVHACGLMSPVGEKKKSVVPDPVDQIMGTIPRR